MLQAEEEMRASPSLLSLPPELVVMVASHLDVSSYLALASTSSAILDILVSPPHWKALLQKTRMKKNPGFGYKVEEGGMEQEVKELAGFIKFATDPKGILLLDLLEHICERFLVDPKFENDYMSASVASVSCPCLAIHKATSFGFALLEQAEIEVRGAGAKPQQNLVAYKGSGLEHLEAFASRAARQKPKFTKIEIFCMDNSGGWGGGHTWKVWLKLIQNSKSWKIENLTMLNYLFLDLVEGLAKEAAQGAVGMMRINDICIANSQMAHLKRLWKITEGEWVVERTTRGFNNTMLHNFWLRKGQTNAHQKWKEMIAVIKTLK